MSRAQLVAMAQRNIAHTQSQPRAIRNRRPSASRRPATPIPTGGSSRWTGSSSVCRCWWPSAVSCGSPDSYKAMRAAGVPILVTRTRDGEIKAFVNMCSHRGAIVVADGCGTARGFSCPYHGWAYDSGGRLVGITNRSEFGEVETENLGLTPLPAGERAGMVFVGLTPGADLHLDAFLAGYDDVLAHFNFGDWHLFSRREIEGPNWKLAYDGYLDYYHLPILHQNSFGPDASNKAIYHVFGPHQRMSRPDPSLLELADSPDDWDINATVNGVWTMFPNISMAIYRGESVLLSQLFPGPTPDRSITVQSYFLAEPPDEASRGQGRRARRPAGAGRAGGGLHHLLRHPDRGLDRRQAVIPVRSQRGRGAPVPQLGRAPDRGRGHRVGPDLRVRSPRRRLVPLARPERAC